MEELQTSFIQSNENQTDDLSFFGPSSSDGVKFAYLHLIQSSALTCYFTM